MLNIQNLNNPLSKTALGILYYLSAVITIAYAFDFTKNQLLLLAIGFALLSSILYFFARTKTHNFKYGGSIIAISFTAAFLTQYFYIRQYLLLKQQ